MSSRAGWTYNGKHFTETQTERGGLRFFIDGKPTRRSVWEAELRTAMLAPETFLETTGMSLATDAEMAEMERLGLIP